MSSIIVEQTNPIAPSTLAKYNIKQGNVSFNDFVLSYPRGAYTGMRTIGRGSIFELNSHMKRVVTTLTLMKFTPEDKDDEPDDVTQQMESFRHYDDFEEKLVPMIRQGLEAYYDIAPDSLEAKVSLMITYSFELQRPCFAAHVTHLDDPPRERVKVSLENRVRTTPAAKDSKWVRERQSLERNKEKDINEVVLTDDQGNIYEGMASNFFAVRKRHDHGNEEHGDIGDNSQNEDGRLKKSEYVVQCASLEYILLGTVMKVVMAVCEQERIDIEWVFPKVQDARHGKWEGCFLASTSRLFLPIKTIYPKDGSSTIEFPPSDFIQQLKQKVTKETYKRGYPILEVTAKN